MPTLPLVAAAVDALLGSAAGSGESTVIVRPRTSPVARLGLALEPDAGLRAWIDAERLDALLLHRHWRLDIAELPHALGVLANHDPFDEALGLGRGEWLAERLGGELAGTIGERDGIPLGALVELPEPLPATALTDALAAEFGQFEAVVPGQATTVRRVATARAMTDALVREAAARGAGAWVTGQLRRPADAAVRDTGILAVAVGHRRSELWALARLAAWLAPRLPDVTVLVRPG